MAQNFIDQHRYIEVNTIEYSGSSFPNAFSGHENWNYSPKTRWLDVKYLAENASPQYFHQLLTIIPLESLDYIAQSYENQFVDWIITFYISQMKLANIVCKGFKLLKSKPNKYQSNPNVSIQLPVIKNDEIIEFDSKNMEMSDDKKSIWINMNIFINVDIRTIDNLILLVGWSGINLILNEIETWKSSNLLSTIVNIKFHLQYYKHIYWEIVNMFGMGLYPEHDEHPNTMFNPNNFVLSYDILRDAEQSLEKLGN